MEPSRPVREYFESRNAFDVESALAQFEDDAVVEDEHREFAAAIRSEPGSRRPKGSITLRST